MHDGGAGGGGVAGKNGTQFLLLVLSKYLIFSLTIKIIIGQK